jgi:hypothetical protein
VLIFFLGILDLQALATLLVLKPIPRDLSARAAVLCVRVLMNHSSLASCSNVKAVGISKKMGLTALIVAANSAPEQRHLAS